MNESKTSSQKITHFSAAQKDKLLEVLKEKKVLQPKWRIGGEWVGHPVFTCSVCPWGKYTTQLPTGGSETKGPAQACHSSEFRHLLSASNEEQRHTINICQIDYLKSRTLYLNMMAVKTEPSWVSLLNFFLWLSWVIRCTINTGRGQFTISSWRWIDLISTRQILTVSRSMKEMMLRLCTREPPRGGLPTKLKM